MSQVEPQYDDAGNLIPPAAATPPPPPAPAGPSERELFLEKQNAALTHLQGADLSSALGQMFLDSYKGDLTADALQAGAAAVGLWTAPTPPPAPGATPDEAELQAIRDGVQGAPGSLAPPTAEELAAAIHPSDRGFAEMHRRELGGLPKEDAAAAWINGQVVAAIEGDQRAVVQPWTADQLAGRAPATRAATAAARG